MLLHNPIFLILIFLPLACYSVLKPPSGPLRFLWLLTAFLLVFAMSGPAFRLPARSGLVVTVADRSLSMPEQASGEQKEVLKLLEDSRKSGDRLAVVSFGESAAVEAAPNVAFSGFSRRVGSGQSNLNDALDMALNLCPDDRSCRILVLSDGQWTGGDPIHAASRAAAAGVGIDYRIQQRETVGDVAIHRVNQPVSLTPGQSFMLTGWTYSPVETVANYSLVRGETVISAGETTLKSGYNRLMFRDRAEKPGTLSYTFSIMPVIADPVPENNTARILVGVDGPRPILHITEDKTSSLGNLLKAGKLEVSTRLSNECRFTLEELSAFSAVIIENVPAQKLGVANMENMVAWLKNAGTGVMMTGGKNAYGPGGYFQSPLDPVMPVSMELRTEHRKLSLAIVVALDRSGSMGAPAGVGRTKMDLANLGTAQVLDLLSDMDEMGVLAVDSSPHEIIDLSPVEEVRARRQKILSIDSQGGGIFVFQALSAATEMLMKAKAGTRHVILFADAADAEEPGAYKGLLEKCRGVGITVSVVGLGTERDSDAAFLKDVAARGEGRIFFSTHPGDLPRLFAQDTFAVARSTFIEEPSSFKFTGGYVTLAGTSPPPPPQIGGYNLCYIKPDANLAAVTQDDYDAPIVAARQAGAGRVLCYTGEAGGKYAGELPNWEYAGEFFTALARWTAGAVDELPPTMLLTQKIEEGACVITLHLDPGRESDPFGPPPKIKSLYGSNAETPRSMTSAMRWISADELETRIMLKGSETLLPTVEFEGGSRKVLAPVRLPYSPEFRPPSPAKGADTLAAIAVATGGSERINVTGIWDLLPKRPRFIEFSPWLYGAALLCFLLSILQRRTGLPFVGLRRKRSEQPVEEPQSASSKTDARRPERRAAKIRTKESPSASAPSSSQSSEQDQDSTLSAMELARKRAGHRTKR